TGSYEEGEEDGEEEEVDEDGDEEMDDSLRGSRGLTAETNAVAHQPEYNSSINASIGTGYSGSNNIAALSPQQQQQQQPYEPENMYVPMASTSIAKGKQVAAASARAEDGDYGAPSRAASSSSRSRTSVYIQTSVDIDSAARYGEGYKHMNIDKHDDGSLVVATPEEAAAGAGAGASQSNNDGFMPALISAARRKREIQIVSFQNSVDAPNNAISGPHAGPPGSSAANVSSNGLMGDNANAGELPLFEGAQRARHEEEGAEEERGDEERNDNAAASGEGSTAATDLVLDIAVNAMMESMSASQAVMQIRCQQCPESAPVVLSQEWETHRDWHIARHLQERELRHDQVAQHIQQAFVRVEVDRPAAKRAKFEDRVVKTAAASSSSSSTQAPAPSSASKRRQQTISEVWK
ncbi:hypothetical protein GGH99_005822, partial [Coemansia sp. RSA 1285]